MAADPLDRRRQSGFTVAETMIGSALMLVVMTFAFQALVSLQNAETRVNLRGQTTDQGHLALEQIETEARSANLLGTPTSNGTALTLYTQTNGKFLCAQWKVVSGSLETRTFSPTWSVDGIVSGWRVVATNVINGTNKDPMYPSTTPIFSVTSSTTLVVDLLTNADSGHSNYLTLQTSVTGRDIEYNVSSSACSSIPS